MSDETIEEWAARVAPDGDRAGWGSVRDSIATGRPWTTFGPHTVSLEQCKALETYRDEVAAGLSPAQRGALDGLARQRRAKMPEALGSWGGYANAYFIKTDFGREIARVLEARHG